MSKSKLMDERLNPSHLTSRSFTVCLDPLSSVSTSALQQDFADFRSVLALYCYRKILSVRLSVHLSVMLVMHAYTLQYTEIFPPHHTMMFRVF